jgi:uncharacterized membrane protein YkoI
MSMSDKMRNGAMAVAAIGALALGGSAIAGAATSGSSSSSSSGTAAQTAQTAQGAPQRPADPTVAGGHVGANGKTEQALSSSDAAEVEAAAKAKLPGGTVLRVETDVDHGSPYEAHVRKADGTEVEVLVNSSFEVTAVNAMGHP